MMSSRLLSAAVIGTAIALLGGGLYLALGEGGGSEQSADSIAPATRPPVVGEPVVEESVVQEPVASNVAASTEASTPVDTEPTADTTLPVSDADDGLFPVPNVLGTTLTIAETRLSVFDVTTDVVAATNVNDFDEITQQTPAGGERLEAGGTVELVFSERPRPETVSADPFPSDAVDSVDMDALNDGDCAVFRIDERLLVFDPIDCAEAHDAQLLARFDLVDGPADYDEDTIDALLRAHCDPLFLDYVGVSKRNSEAFRVFTVRPNAERYVSEGERDSLCVILPNNGVRTLGSAEGTLW